jgi:hypothetical protein
LKFPDCGESSLRNFINVITYNMDLGIYNLEILDILGAVDELKEYYTVFNNEELQSSIQKVDIFGGLYNAREAWVNVVSNLPNVLYVKEHNGYKYEMAGIKCKTLSADHK